MEFPASIGGVYFDDMIKQATKANAKMPANDHAIEVFHDLYLTCPKRSDSAISGVLCRHAQPPWRHAGEAEDRISSAADVGPYAVFERERADGVPAARLVLYQEAGRYKVANIVPTECQELGETGYNDVLNDFLARVAEPAQSEGVSVEVTKRWQTITDWTSKEAANALHLFSVMANKATGSSHPMDAERWREFLIADHRAQGNLSSYHLRRWLVEVEDWPFEEARDLVNERDTAAELLRHYDHCD